MIRAQTRVYNTLNTHTQLNSTDLRVLNDLLTYTQPTRRETARRVGVSRRTVCRAVARLRAAGVYPREVSYAD